MYNIITLSVLVYNTRFSFSILYGLKEKLNENWFYVCIYNTRVVCLCVCVYEYVIMYTKSAVSLASVRAPSPNLPSRLLVERPNRFLQRFAHAHRRIPREGRRDANRAVRCRGNAASRAARRARGVSQAAQSERRPGVTPKISPAATTMFTRVFSSCARNIYIPSTLFYIGIQ